MYLTSTAKIEIQLNSGYSYSVSFTRKGGRRELSLKTSVAGKRLEI
jgi:hypothetical protein